MRVLVRQTTGDSFQVVAGVRRLKVALQVFGKVSVTDVETGESFEVHEVEGQVVALQQPGEAAAEVAAEQAIHRASQH